MSDTTATVIWQPQPGPQTALLQCPVFEIFYGGARGGGKTESSIGDWLQHSAAYGENAIGIFFRRKLVQLAEVIAKALLGKQVSASPSMEPLREAVMDKDLHWYNRYHASDGNDVWGSRSTLSFTNGQTNAVVLQHELSMLDVMTANRDERVWARITGGDKKIDDSNVPKPVPVISNVGGGSKSSSAQKEGILKYISGEEAIKHMAVKKGFEVHLFADETRFPQIANPVQMQFDSKGRLWVAAWPTYPKWEPLKEMNDALVILHDDNNDGSADRATEFARVQNPLGFEFWNGGVLVTRQSEILFLKDTDGDDKADVQTIMLMGLDSSDSHHGANNLIYGPDGGLYWQSGVFMQHNHEHPWGPSLNTGASAMYRFDPRRFTIARHADNSPNPHGTSFDSWGYQYATDGTGGRAYQVRPDGNGFKMYELLKKEVRPVTASEVVSSTHFPEAMQGDFLICNVIGFLGVKHYHLERDADKGTVWGEPAGDELTVKVTQADGTVTEETSRGFLMSGDKNFRPSDAVFAPDGSLYLSDWHNVIIGHMQHNVRDPNRDHAHGRVYRITATGRPLQQVVPVDGQPIPALLENLKHPADGVRHRSHIELSERDTKEVIAATQSWMKQFDPTKKEDAHNLLEALWIHQQHNVRNVELLGQLQKSPELHARNAANVVQHLWFNVEASMHGGVIAAEAEEKAQKSGILSDTPELTTIRVATIPERMMYDVKELTVKPGKKVKLTFANEDFMPHNIMLENPGKIDEIAGQALVMGAKGSKNEPHRVGAIAAKCVRKAPVDVLVVREDAQGPFKKIVTCVDFSENSAKAVQCALHVAQQLPQHVAEPADRAQRQAVALARQRRQGVIGAEQIPRSVDQEEADRRSVLGQGAVFEGGVEVGRVGHGGNIG